MKKILFTDIDGTIIGKSHQINKKVRKCLESKDFEIVLATGRSAVYVEEIGLNLDAICSNGAEILKKNGEIIYVGNIPFKKAQEIIHICENNKLLYVVSTNVGNLLKPQDNFMKTIFDLAYLHDGDEEELIKAINLYFDLIFRRSLKVENMSTYLVENEIIITKIEIFTNEPKEKIKKLFLNIDGIKVFTSHISNLEITLTNISKAAAIDVYLQNKEKYHVFAVGDSENDLEMLKYANTPFAMGNAIKEVKEIVNNIVEDVENDGFITVFEYVKNYK